MSDPTPELLQKRLSASLLRIRREASFFATLALFARVRFVEHLPTAATNGRDIFWNPQFLMSLQQSDVDGVMLHEVLHAALLHVPRRGARDPLIWNVAADIVVNGMIAALPHFTLPAGTLRDEELEKFSVEEVYELVMKQGNIRRFLLDHCDLLDLPEDATGADLEAAWREARAQAAAIAQSAGYGTMPAGMAREFGAVEASRLDWRSHLWRYLVRTPTDFSEFDRRFIGRGLYVEALESESLRVHVAVDTSGSIGGPELDRFLGEVRGILSAYPHILCDLYYVDAAADGPHSLNTHSAVPPPTGGGGTDFRPFFQAVEKEANGEPEGVYVYLTDGFGTFPEHAPSLPVLWVVTAGGLDLDEFPFGESVRLV